MRFAIPSSLLSIRSELALSPFSNRYYCAFTQIKSSFILTSRKQGITSSPESIMEAVEQREVVEGEQTTEIPVTYLPRE